MAGTDDSGRRTLPRRALLASVAVGSAALVAGCTSSSSRPGPTQSGLSGSGLPSDDDGVRAQRVATELGLLAAYDQALAGARLLSAADDLRTFRAHHLAHLTAIDPTRDPALATAAPPSSAPTTIAQLQKLETQAAATAVDLGEVTGSPELVQLLTQIGACEAAHASLLASTSASSR